MTRPPSTPSRARRTSAGLLALTTAGLLAACGPGDGTTPAEASASSEPVAGGSITWALETEPLTLNAQVNGQNKAKLLLRNVFDSYLYKNADGTYDPWLAESYEYDEAQTTLTLVLRDDVTFSDGDPLDAQAVLTNLEQLRVEGYSSAATFALRSVTDVSATDERTVVFTLSQPDAFLLDWLSSLNGAPVSPTSIAGAADLAAGGPDVAGTGPFVVESSTPGQDVVLAQREDYDWAPEAAQHDGAAYLERVTYRFLPEASTRTGALSSGQVDVVDGVPSVDVSLFEDSDDFTYGRVVNNGLPYTYYFNVSRAPFDDVRVRRAFVQAVDLDAVLQGIHHGRVERALAPVSPVSPFLDDSVADAYAADVNGANDLLDEAGWTERDAEGYRTKDGRRLTVRAVAASPYLRDNRDLLGQGISAAVKDSAGIDFQFQVVDSGTAQEASAANEYEIFDNSRGDSDSGQPLVFLYSSEGILARGHFDDVALDELLLAASTTNDVGERTSLYAQAQQHIAENAYSFPLYAPQDNFAASSAVHGIATDDAAGVVWSAYDVWKDPNA